MEFLTGQTREANEEKASVEAECRKLQRQVRDLSASLTECKDDLMRLQPTSQVSDNEISDQYSDLDQQISGWVDDKTEDSQILEDQFDKIKAIEDLPELFRDYISNDQLRMAKKYPDSQPILVRYLVHRYLETFVFDNDIYLFGLDSKNIALLRGLEEGMKLLEPRRGRSLRGSMSHGFGSLTRTRCSNTTTMAVRNPPKPSQDGHIHGRAGTPSPAHLSNPPIRTMSPDLPLTGQRRQLGRPTQTGHAPSHPALHQIPPLHVRLSPHLTHFPQRPQS